jgi:hypothetical protein
MDPSNTHTQREREIQAYGRLHPLHTDRKTNRQKDKQTDRKKDR